MARCGGKGHMKGADAMTTMGGRYARRTGGFVLAAALVFISPARADDAGLRQRIEARLSKAGLADHGQVEVDVTNGVAVLSGFTTTVDAQRRAEKAARKETKTVDNRLRVVPLAREDAEIRKAVADAVLGYVYYGVFDSVGVAVDHGVVTLQGSVLEPWRKDEIERRVARLDGIREVQNQIRVQPVSGFDDRLRSQLYRRIYANGLFQRYATFVNPPIRIIVDHGNITLTGVVNSRVERVALESIARGVLAFKVDNQVQVESDIEKEPAASTPTE
jgi:hyperosmotically inducible periplasmic protein